MGRASNRKGTTEEIAGPVSVESLALSTLEELKATDWVEREHVMTRRFQDFVIGSCCLIVICTLVMYFLQGFGCFHLPESALKSLGLSTLGAVFTIAAIIAKLRFK